MRWLLRIVTLIVSLPLVFAAAAYLAAIVPGDRAAVPAGTDNLIALARGPIHYDILIPLRDDTRRRFDFAAGAGVPVAMPQAEWLVVGWGAERFYTTVGTWGDVTAGAVLRAVTGDRAVVHLDVAGFIGAQASVTYLTLSDLQFSALIDAIDAAFLRDQTGAPVPLASKFGAHDAFFAANGRFDLIHTCNDWVGEVLRAAGVPLGAWTPLPQTLRFSLDWHGLGASSQANGS